MYYFIVNPKSSSGKGLRIWNSIEPILKGEAVPYHVFFTQNTENTIRLARRLSDKKASSVIVAVGGDGTVNAVINGLTDFSRITFGCIPTGSGNDFARGLHLESDPIRALQNILHPSEIRPIAVGSLTTPDFSRRFVVSSGIGFDAAVCAGALDSKIKNFLNRLGLGTLTYTGIALRQIALARYARVTLTLEDASRVEYPAVFFAAAMNLPYEGGGFMFCPDARGDDDQLDLILVEKFSKLKVLLMLPTAFFGKHTRFRGIHIRPFQKATFTSDRPLFVHTDGEIPGKAVQVSWSLLPEKLPFILK